MISTAPPPRDPGSREPQARSAPLPIVLPGNGNASNDKQVFTPSKRPKPPKTPKAIAKRSNKLQAKPPKSDDGEEEEEEEEVEDGSVKVKESLQLLKTTLRRLRNSELLQCDSHVILEALKALGLGTQRKVVSTRLQALEVRLTLAPTADGASCIELDDRLPYHHVGDDGHVTPAQASLEVDGGFTIATPAANHAVIDQPALAQGSRFPQPQPAAIQTS
ncbi:hypothetical protein D6C99_04975 [Aureobasidium pullulans]|nr:hypothetical protein D6D29_05688 [Aureobasidium pullulans]THY49899.1 hypothetical protein D6C99_04975 [Aureobasidium pullulans]